MIGAKGAVGKWKINWKKVPRGPRGTAFFEAENGEKTEVSWQRDRHGLWIELPHGVFGYDTRGELDDEGVISYRVFQRGRDMHWDGVAFRREGEEHALSGAKDKKKVLKVKAEMPGKIVKVLVKEGQQVEKGTPLLIMEAMKMENEVTAAGEGKVTEVKISEGEAVDAGALLAVIRND